MYQEDMNIQNNVLFLGGCMRVTKTEGTYFSSSKYGVTRVRGYSVMRKSNFISLSSYRCLFYTQQNNLAMSNKLLI